MPRIAALFICVSGIALAQPQPEPSRVPAEIMGDRPSTRPADERPADRARLPEAATRADAPLEQGATSFTEAQARSRMEQAGFTQITELRLAEGGIWRAAAQRDGRPLRVGLDYRGTVRVD